MNMDPSGHRQCSNHWANLAGQDNSWYLDLEFHTLCSAPSSFPSTDTNLSFFFFITCIIQKNYSFPRASYSQTAVPFSSSGLLIALLGRFQVFLHWGQTSNMCPFHGQVGINVQPWADAMPGCVPVGVPVSEGSKQTSQQRMWQKNNAIHQLGLFSNNDPSPAAASLLLLYCLALQYFAFTLLKFILLSPPSPNFLHAYIFKATLPIQ